MKKYSQSPVAGESWVRAKRIVIENPLGQDSTIKFVEEKIVLLEDSTVSEDVGVLSSVVTSEDMSKEIVILDPATGSPSGQVVTYGELHTIIASVYMQLAIDRDFPPPPAGTPTNPEEDPIGGEDPIVEEDE